MKQKRKNIIKFHQRNKSLEALTLEEKMGKIDERLENHSSRRQLFMTDRKISLERLNASIIEKLNTTRNEQFRE